MAYRNLLILFVCQLISATGSIIVVTLGGIIGATLSTTPSLATLPVSMMVVFTAATTVPATLLMRRLGRRAGFALASLSAAAAVLVATLALRNESFVLFTVAAAGFGINMAFTQQYRYAAAESAPARYTARAVSLVLLGSIGGAVLGPELITQAGGSLQGVAYGGTLLILAVLYFLQSLLFLALGPLHGELPDVGGQGGRPLAQIVRQPVYIVAVIGGAAGYGIMALIMTATPLSMHVHDGYSMADTAAVIKNHVIAMYAPSLVSGFLIERLGTVRMMAAGAVTLVLSCVVALQGQALAHYGLSLILLGVGWNFLYVGGTTLLTRTYHPNERFRAQAVNEFSVFGTCATASLLAGTMIHLFGWTTLVLVPLPFLALTLAGLWYVRHDARNTAAAASA